MKHDLKFKDFKLNAFEVKKDTQGTDRLIISGWAARFGNIDSYGDIIEQGAFSKTIKDRGSRIAFCYQHEIDEPIGKIMLLEERPEGLWIEVQLSASEDDIQTKIKEGILTEMSIGYCTVNCTEEVINEKYITHLTEIKLYEVSLVTIAANELATIQGMKSEDHEQYLNTEFDRLIALERNNSRKYDLMKIKSHVKALFADYEPPKSTPKKTEEPQKYEMTKEDILKILRN